MDSDRLAELRALANDAQDGTWLNAPIQITDTLHGVTLRPQFLGLGRSRFIAACNPLVVLELVSELETVRELLRQHVMDWGNESCADLACDCSHQKAKAFLAALGDSK